MKALFSLALTAIIATPAAADFRPKARDFSTPANPPIVQAQASGGFEAWKADFRRRAIAAGISPKVFDIAFQGVRPNEQVHRLAAKQPEFTKPIWEYLDSAVSSDRINNGRQSYRNNRQLVESIEKTYGVEASVVVAVWGMETNYGTYRGNIGTIESLATLAYTGSRKSFGEEQLMAALKILQNGDVHPSQMKGSWAGAMGHTQFIPTSYLSYAQDFNRDGRRDVWSTDPTDALASTAAYLKRFGWRHGQPWGVEVRLPQGFNYANVDQDLKRPVSRWTELGVRGLDGRPVPNHGEAALLAPAGARGPIFMIFNNFNVIKRYNNATSYAMGVGHLAARINGAPDFSAGWPRGDRALSRTEKLELQRHLNARGFSVGSPDGKIGPLTIGAIRNYQRSQGLTADGYASATLLQRIRSQ
ncbi:lytic murein transglycosylase [Algicella marina]|uniref:Lytic murein transglycosylase n=1 Tax=Algicella marina TaxID=2683284 RepID=A0A6P1T374_9RHOB|nr:lytic murein transglycosylase [Algicella marina]